MLKRCVQGIADLMSGNLGYLPRGKKSDKARPPIKHIFLFPFPLIPLALVIGFLDVRKLSDALKLNESFQPFISTLSSFFCTMKNCNSSSTRLHDHWKAEYSAGANKH
ncbi:hypothetical protein BaRGS_00014595 [Batillaria attramentaria]|uniref:Uncharacterized protein n=1 Tax=Batillaria attramentaria TaxID=370345 RepID=A0ABD0L451_9CAEN